MKKEKDKRKWYDEIGKKGGGQRRRRKRDFVYKLKGGKHVFFISFL